MASLEQAGVDARGSTPYFGAARRRRRSCSSRRSGDDERSADLLFRVYRRVQPRDLGDERPFSSLRRAVEHEALVALAARDVGVRTPRLAAVRHRRARRLRPRLRGHRGTVARPARARRADRRGARRDLGPGRPCCAGTGSPTATCAWPTCSWPTTAQAWMIDFGFSELRRHRPAAGHRRGRAAGLVSIAVGAERAVAQAVDAVAPGRLAAAARPPPPADAERRHPHRAQGRARAPRRAASPRR